MNVRYLHCKAVFDPASGKAVSPGTIVIDEDGRIADVQEGHVPIPGEAELVNLKEFTVLPGLVDAHDHLGIDLGGSSRNVTG